MFERSDNPLFFALFEASTPPTCSDEALMPVDTLIKLKQAGYEQPSGLDPWPSFFLGVPRLGDSDEPWSL